MGAWEDFKNNPSVGTYLDWVRDSMEEYADVIEEENLNVGSDVGALAGAAAEQSLKGAKKALEEAFPIAKEIANATLDIVKGLGVAIIEGLDNTYDAARDRMRGKEPDIIAGIVIVGLSVGTVLFLYYSMKATALGPALKVK